MDSREYFLKRKGRQKSENIYAEITRFQKKLGQQINVSNIVKVRKCLYLSFPSPLDFGKRVSWVELYRVGHGGITPI